MKKTWIIILLLTICICTYITIRAYHYYTPPRLRQPYQISNHHNHDDTLRIAYIGDSWAYLHNCHNCIIAQIIEDSTHHPVSVQSFGICGLTSKEIYEHIYNDPDYNHLLQDKSYDYCIVSAGINDSYKKMGTRYYKISMQGIIEFLLANNIHPIILEIPNYDITKAFENQKIEKKILRQLSMLINSITIDCKNEYRDALNELIKDKFNNNYVSVIRYNTWNNNSNRDLKLLYNNDGMHLNKYGYSVLDSIIVKEILKVKDKHKVCPPQIK